MATAQGVRLPPPGVLGMELGHVREEQGISCSWLCSCVAQAEAKRQPLSVSTIYILASNARGAVVSGPCAKAGRA